MTPERCSEFGVAYADLETLLDTADYVSLHCPSNDATKDLIGADALARMKPTSSVINTSRGDVIDESALLEALESGQIAGAALDVRVQEPPGSGDRLAALENVISTPHAAFYSTESLIELRERTALETLRVIEGEAPDNLVNPEYRNHTV